MSGKLTLILSEPHLAFRCALSPLQSKLLGVGGLLTGVGFLLLGVGKTWRTSQESRQGSLFYLISRKSSIYT